MKTASMRESCRHFRRALDAAQRGDRVLVTFRGQPVARLEPVPPAAIAVPDDDSLLRIEDFAVNGPGGALPNGVIDRTVYGS